MKFYIRDQEFPDEASAIAAAKAELVRLKPTTQCWRFFEVEIFSEKSVVQGVSLTVSLMTDEDPTLIFAGRTSIPNAQLTPSTPHKFLIRRTTLTKTLED